ncbi:MAG: hypothetical protein AB7N65_21680 [Vicinamibacterales bacterium]
MRQVNYYPDYGQPTHFDPRQSHGIFAIKVPNDFGSKRLTWTLTVNGQTSVVSFWKNPPYVLDFFKHAASGNTPPVVRFAESGPTHAGPPFEVAQTLTATVGQPQHIRMWASDAPATMDDASDELAAIRSRTSVVDPVAIVGDQTFGGTSRPRAPSAKADIVVTWKVHRAPGGVTLSPARIPLVTEGDRKLFLDASTRATFAAPGEYVLRAQ